MAFLAVSALYPQFSTTTWMAVIPKPRTPIRKVLRKRQKSIFLTGKKNNTTNKSYS